MFDRIATEYKMSKVKSARRDLNDDNDAIREINSRIDEISEELRDFIRTDTSRITERLDNLKEPKQGNDSDIRNARTYLQYEIDRLEDSLNT